MPRKKGRTANLMYEKQIRAQGFDRIVGIDEAGRGPWAGPVVVGAVCLPLREKKLTTLLSGVRDSKTMTPRQRDLSIEKIKETSLAWGIGAASNAEIDEHGIVPATKFAMTRALDLMLEQFPDFKPQCLFLDALVWPEMVTKYPQVSLVGGDGRSLSIAAASVLAKTHRDALMVELDEQYPGYGFASHKGYGTAEHRAALEQQGVSSAHRVSFRPVSEIAEKRSKPQ
jgi:ribonuclease HII